jgi:DNA-binding response OmpR family regulator
VRILVAEDLASTRWLIAETLREMGHEVTAAADGAEAWEAFQRERHPLVIVDWLMPAMDGISLTARIREHEPRRETFILLETGRGTSEDVALALQAGVDDYITKPLTTEHLRARVTIAERRIELDRQARLAEEAHARGRWLRGVGETTLAVQHEINTPLTTLLAELEHARESSDPAEREGALSEASEQARRIAEVLRRLEVLADPRSIVPEGGLGMIDLAP